MEEIREENLSNSRGKSFLSSTISNSFLLNMLLSFIESDGTFTFVILNLDVESIKTI